MRALTIVGKGTGYEQAKLDSQSSHIWATSTAFELLRASECRVDSIFQLHGLDLFEPWLADVQDRLVLMVGRPGLERARILPADILVAVFGARFGGSVSWMMALAILDGYTEIRFRGIHLSHFSEYGNQRDSFFYLWGRAEARGVRIITDPSSGIAFPEQTYGRT